MLAQRPPGHRRAGDGERGWGPAGQTAHGAPHARASARPGPDPPGAVRVRRSEEAAGGGARLAEPGHRSPVPGVQGGSAGAAHVLTETPRLAPREGQPADWRRWPPGTNQRRVLSTERAALCREKTPPGALTAERSHRPLGQDRLTRAGGPNAAGDSGLKPVLTGRSEDPRP